MGFGLPERSWKHTDTAHENKEAKKTFWKRRRISCGSFLSPLGKPMIFDPDGWMYKLTTYENAMDKPEVQAQRSTLLELSARQLEGVFGSACCMPMTMTTSVGNFLRNCRPLLSCRYPSTLRESLASRKRPWSPAESPRLGPQLEVVTGLSRNSGLAQLAGTWIFLNKELRASGDSGGPS
ncbi:hypothetical protein RvY_14723 [Ramazzottius varieornatus]|uniref:Uncharacterized protein n=1 Tax=Ramazzottius varieornatus TaxID=947166 RepID=A0A1D1W0N0_RAMVA|nr:hypothetical protein RvY_14723 [Ramazzottius varieornatus]